MANNVTRCPKCDTSFRVTDAHLNSAKGAVRCGSCLNIFNARNHLVSDEKKTQDEDDILISDDMEEEEDLYASSGMEGNVIMASTFGPSESNLFEREYNPDDDDDESDTDESWAESLLDDDDDHPGFKVAREPEPEPEPEPPKRELFKAREAKSGESGQFYGEEPPAPPGAKLDPDHFSLIDDLRHSEDENDPVTHLAQSEQEGTYQDDLDDEPYTVSGQAEADDDFEEDYIQTDYERFEAEPAIGDIGKGDIDEIDDYAYQDQFGATSNSRFIHAIEPEPVEFNVSTRYPIWQSKGLWAGLAATAGTLFIVQLAIFRFDDLSTIEPWRSYYGKVCGFLSCELPQLRDRGRIKASNLVVRTHPAIEDALMVDAIINNTARFPQRFPPLDLVFVDIKNNPVAARRFEATEYLGGELAGRDAMPVNQPVHIAIEINDPGPEAVSYFITIPD